MTVLTLIDPLQCLSRLLITIALLQAHAVTVRYSDTMLRAAVIPKPSCC